MEPMATMHGSESQGDMQKNTMPMSGMPKDSMPINGMSVGAVMSMIVMWIAMMVGMMVPSFSAMILAFSGINLQKRLQGRAYVRTPVFLSGYLVVWSGFGVAAAGLQLALQSLSIMKEMAIADPILAATILLIAGAYQFTVYKHACLSHCRSPMSHIMNQWREGKWGAFLMGLSHGMYCIGCCWALMLIMFAIGTMNLVVMASLTLYLLVEKILPFGHITARATGGILILLGIATISGQITWGGM
ncbi:DUF2182 domain-containing protein [Sneathiella chungangensis]|uniref:DUF2182 domain-containing protein n=1 Tax=Sneathiella chungangensis TaxID=1418234 RepID=A0A845MJR8_9PROT|nr:DUF2182 domain-containing protein [Sneathiella chungangensis]MZR23925.1 DUF2182 domain-containing protein [Sneathiella chungangensis]